MTWLNKIFGKKEGDASVAAPKDNATGEDIFAGLSSLQLGRYSDNNKTYRQTQTWYNAEDLFKEKKYSEAINAFFDYLRDDQQDNVHYNKDGDTFTFDLIQGSKLVQGKGDGARIVATTQLAGMKEPNTAAMRRMLDLNFNMYYSRTALDDDNVLCMIFDTDISSLNTNKLYYALRELAIKADRTDDILLEDFSTLSPVGREHMTPLPEQELQVRYRYFCKWITDTLKLADSLNQDTFSGAIAYLLPGVLYRIDFFMAPEAGLLAEMERISSVYWERKEDTPLVERNQVMKEGIRKMLGTTTIEKFAANVFHSKATFAVSMPPKPDKIRDNIYNANKDARWYAENKYPDIALALVEYGVLYSQFIYSVPGVITGLTAILMAVLHPQYFIDNGMQKPLYNEAEKTLDKSAIENGVNYVLNRYREKFKSMKWDASRIKYDNRYDFAVSFTEQIAGMNLETKR